MAIKLKSNSLEHQKGVNKDTIRFVHAELYMAMKEGRITYRMREAQKLWDEIHKEAGFDPARKEEYTIYFMCYLMDYQPHEVKDIILQAKPNKIEVKS